MELRLANRDEHRAYVPDNDSQIVFVGPMLDGQGNQCGSLYVFEADSEQEIQGWLELEPFVKAGVYRDIIVRRFELGVNRLPLQEWPLQRR